VPETLTFRQHMTIAARSYLVQTLDMCCGNVTETAKVAQLSRDAIYGLFKELGLKADDFRAKPMERKQRYGPLRHFAGKNWLATIESESECGRE
jgi:hypothetical protein